MKEVLQVENMINGKNKKMGSVSGSVSNIKKEKWGKSKNSPN
jgi:hypothetical protein